MKTNYNKGIRFLYSFLISINLFFPYQFYAQSSSTDTKTIFVTVTDKKTGEVLPFSNVVASALSGFQIKVSTANLDGEAKLVLPAMDDYVIKAVYIGYYSKQDTLSCTKKGCIRSHTLALEQDEPITHWDGDTHPILGSDENYESEEEVWEAERLYERTEEEFEILEDLNDFVCFPNPVVDLMNVSVDGIYATELLMFNVNGELLYKKEITDEEYEFEINMQYFSQGYYYVVCRGEGLSSKTHTILKQ